MKTHRIAPMAALGLLMAAGAAEARTTAPACPAVTEDQVAAQFDRFNSAWATKSPDTVAALFASDATLLATVSNAERTGHDKIRAYFVDFLKAEPVGRIDSSTIVIDCNTASRSGNWTVNMKNANGERVDVSARYSFLYKWDGNDWKIQHLHSSVRPPVNP
ncbi:MAG: SgcJ/EcaC family oxidoreductase [Thermaurantiacus sp.]